MQTVNICLHYNLGKEKLLFQSMIKQISEDNFICRSDTTIAFYLYALLFNANCLNSILIIAILVMLIVYYKRIKSKSTLVLICLNSLLFMITVVPFFLEQRGQIIRWTIYDFAFLTANYESVPQIFAIYAVLLVGYIWFFADGIRRYLKTRNASAKTTNATI
jgi:hypothetical protein